MKLDLPNLQTRVELAPFTTFKIGGSAKWFITVRSIPELLEAVNQATIRRLPYFILGTGANILIGDRGFDGLVIHNQAANFEFEGNKLTAASGATIADLIQAATGEALSGLEHFAGIPSSVGGAIWQNMHFLAPDRKSTVFIAEFVESAKVLDQDQTKTVGTDFFKFGYDDSILRHQPIIVLEVIFKLAHSSTTKIKRQIAANLAWRQAKQPQLAEFASAGSIFKKIEAVGAGRLIEATGLKGKRIGGAEVSTKHANYIINTGKASAKDVKQLIRLIQSQVKAKTGYKLEPEISFIGR